VKVPFDFPVFSDIQLGESGDVEGKGCLITKLLEVSENAQSNHWKLRNRVVKELGEEQYWKLVDFDCPNTIPNRRMAYNALVVATEDILGVTIAKEVTK